MNAGTKRLALVALALVAVIAAVVAVLMSRNPDPDPPPPASDGAVSDAATADSSAPDAHLPDASTEPPSGPLRILVRTITDPDREDPEFPVTKVAMQALIADFQRAYPDIQVEGIQVEGEAKTYLVIERFNELVAEIVSGQAPADAIPDVFTWSPGHEMRQAAREKRLARVSDMWTGPELTQSMAATRAVVTVDGEQYGVPYALTPWVMFARSSLLDKHKAKFANQRYPATWAEFLAVSQAFKEAGVAPLAVGTRYQYSASMWFSYLNLRMNGSCFHRQLMDGQVRYDDARVVAVLDRWQGDLLDKGYFVSGHDAFDGFAAFELVRTGKAAMLLFETSLIDEPDLNEELARRDRTGEAKYRVFPFPVAVPPPAGRDAPEDARGMIAVTDSLHVPAQAPNKRTARVFLAFAATKLAQSQLNQPLLRVPAHKAATVLDHPVLTESARLVHEAQGVSQFYGADTHPEVAETALAGFVEFMQVSDPERRTRILEQLEAQRKETYGPAPASPPKCLW